MPKNNLPMMLMLMMIVGPNAYAEGGGSSAGPAAPVALQCGNLRSPDGSVFVGIKNPALDLYRKSVKAMIEATAPEAQLQFIPLQKMDVMPQSNGSTKYSYQSADRTITFIATVAPDANDPAYEIVSGEFEYGGATAECPVSLIPVVTGP